MSLQPRLADRPDTILVAYAEADIKFTHALALLGLLMVFFFSLFICAVASLHFPEQNVTLSEISSEQ